MKMLTLKLEEHINLDLELNKTIKDQEDLPL